MMNRPLWLNIFLVFALMAGGCAKKEQPAQPPAPEVGVAEIKAAALPVVTELPGRLDAVRTAEVRARATGILLQRTFKEGADVQEGEVLFQIDQAPLKAAYNSAAAALVRAQATLAQAEGKAKRFAALVKVHAVSQQEYEDIRSLVVQSKADVQANQAVVESAALNLGYATVTAPISGRIGTAQVTEGALVSQSNATLLAVIQQLDPIYFDFTQSSTEVLRLKQAFDSGRLQGIAPGEAKVNLLLEDGSVYPQPGKLIFSGISVDPTSGMITLRAVFPNPDHVLLPGMFARGRLEEGVNTQAITVPQRAVVLGPNGAATAMVVTADNTVEVRPIKISTAVGDQWMVTEGLKAGEKVIVEGLQKVKPGMTVKPVAPSAPQAG